ncbi:uncharacterized protein LOC134764909 [Penaeus indicus]|uniref:uncharacterized protein LOC134764909 n=1 Tax=Penaeus indicus TaxID=29960 RepID=UPI00300D4048
MAMACSSPSSVDSFSSSSSSLDSIDISDNSDDVWHVWQDGVVLGYQFEPEYLSEEELLECAAFQPPENYWLEKRMDNTDWCKCDRCVLCESPEENMCCTEKMPIGKI